jgi:hypothetical protein
MYHVQSNAKICGYIVVNCNIPVFEWHRKDHLISNLEPSSFVTYPAPFTKVVCERDESKGSRYVVRACLKICLEIYQLSVGLDNSTLLNKVSHLSAQVH